MLTEAWQWIGATQGGVMRALAAEMRAGGLGTILLAFALGALHALTPGHGKAALASYFLGHEARISKGLRIALMGATLHVLSGFAIFVVLRFVLGQMPSMFGRASPGFTIFGYALIILAGVMMLIQSVRPGHAHHDGGHALTAGIGLLPCPLTISVLGFAWTQSSPLMVPVVLVSLALGIALTIGLVALAAILGRRTIGLALARHLPTIERWSRTFQAASGVLIIVIGVVTIASLW